MKLKSLILLACAAASLSATASHIDTLSITTPYLDGPEKVLVVSPDAAAKDHKLRFPTVYLLNGYSGNHTSWTSLQPRLTGLADSLGLVMVMPDGRDSWYFDSPIDDKMQMESFITRQLVPYIDQNYPTLPDSTKRAITGLSMGGHGALYLAMRHPDIWANVGSTSGGVDILPFPEKWKIKERLGDYNQNAQRWAESSAIAQVSRIKPNQINIIFDCGTDDFFAEVNDRLHQTLRAAKIPHDYISRPGRHSQPYWANSILYQLLYFNEHFRNPAAVAKANK